MEVSQPLDHITHAVIGGGKTIDFGISDSAEFFDILSRTLYTDQILAVVREVLCNAWDAHIAAGKTDTPIQITLDSDHFVVRDFGYGIRHDDIGPIYGVYGASTKKNDGTQTGGFGLGCKAPFAYTDHFEVTSHHVGTKTIYNMSKSNAVAKGKPGIITIASFPTDETGLRVKMPVQNKDWRRFKETIERIVSNGEMKAELNGALLPVLPFSQATEGYLLTTDRVMGDAYVVRGGNNLLLRYGNVIYPVESHEELNDLIMKVKAVVARFLDYVLVLQAPPDSISVTPSRESLSMQEHTVATLKRLFQKFLTNTKGLNNEILIQSKKIVDDIVGEKDYDVLFSQSWGFKHIRAHAAELPLITDVVGMAHYQLTKEYPKDLQFRVQDVDYRIRKAAETKIVDPHLAATFVKELPAVKSLPNNYSYTRREDASDWLHRRIIGKVMVKLRDIGMDDDGLYILDSMQRSYAYDESRIVPVRKAVSRNHLINLPFLRKTVVVTTAMTQLRDRIRGYSRHHPGTPQDGMLCYYIRQRKGDNVANALALFTKLGYEIIDLTKRHEWEVVTKAPMPRKKAEPYPGLPALRNIKRQDGEINVPLFRHKDAVFLPTPELVMVIGARNNGSNNIDGFSPLATQALVKLYGERLGIAQDKSQWTRAIKRGAKDFMPVLEAELQYMLLHSPTVKEYFAYDFMRVKNSQHVRPSTIEALRLIYHDKALRKEFGLPDNLTDEEAAMVNIFNHSTCLSDDCTKPIRTYRDTILLGPENQDAIKAATDNDMLGMLDTSAVRYGLKGPKRQTYLDIFIKVLKG